MFKNILIFVLFSVRSILFSRSSSSPSNAPRRFISSILGGDIPYGSRGHVLTQAQRKEYPPEVVRSLESAEEPNEDSSDDEDSQKLIVDEKPIVPEEEPLSLRTKSTPPPPEKRPSPPPLPESPVPSPPSQSSSPSLASSADAPAVRCSVIQRAQRNKNSPEDAIGIKWSFSEPEQEQPIDYHVPKKSTSEEEESREKRERNIREARKRRAILAAQHAFSMRKLRGILVGAAGHGRTSTSTGGQIGGGSAGGQNHQSSSSSGFNFGGGSASSAGSGSLSGGTGGGGGMGGRDGRSSYGPNSPPTGSLPPFYESLKGGNNANNNTNSFNGNTGYHHIQGSGYHHIMSNNYQDVGGGGGGGSTNGDGKYSMLNNIGYGLVLKDEPDFDYESKMEILNGNYNLNQNGLNPYDIVNDAIIADIAAGGVVDPLQFTATLTTFASPDALDSLSDAVDLSAFLQRLPNDANTPSPSQVELELTSTPSITPDSVTCQVDASLETFKESLLQQMHPSHHQTLQFDHQRFLPNSTKMYQQHTTPPPPYPLHMQHQQPQQQHNHQHYQGLNNNNNNSHPHNHHNQQNSYHHYGSDNSNISLPSPASSNGGGANVGIDSPPDAKPLIQSVSFYLSNGNSINNTIQILSTSSQVFLSTHNIMETTDTTGGYNLRPQPRRQLVTTPLPSVTPPLVITTNCESSSDSNSRESNVQNLQKRVRRRCLFVVLVIFTFVLVFDLTFLIV